MPPDASDRILAALARIEARLATVSELERLVDGLARGSATGAHRPPPPKRVDRGGNEEEVWLEIPEARIASVLGPFANEQRVKLLKALYLGITESSRLKEFTGLTGGQLYHHLKELALAKFLSRQVRGEYHLSAFGYYAFSAVMILVADLLTEEPDEDLVTPEEIELD